MSAYPHISAFLRGAGKWLLGCLLPFMLGAYLGYDRGHDDGRLEMKCAIFGVFDRIGATADTDAANVGCEKLGDRK